MSLTSPRAVLHRRLASPSAWPPHADPPGCAARLLFIPVIAHPPLRRRGFVVPPQPLPALRWHEPSAAVRRLCSFVCCSGSGCVRAGGCLSYRDTAGPCPGASLALGSACSGLLCSSRAAPEGTEDRALLGLLRPGAAMLSPAQALLCMVMLDGGSCRTA